MRNLSHGTPMSSGAAGATVLQVAVTAVMLFATVFLTGCASKGARDEASLYKHDRSAMMLTPPAPRPVVRGDRQGLGRGAPPAALMDDESRYSAIYGVPPREDYRGYRPQGEDVEVVEPDPQDDADAYRSQPVAAPAAIASGERRIVVTTGDTLHSIAWRYKTTVTALLRANRMSNTSIQVGQELTIPSRR